MKNASLFAAAVFSAGAAMANVGFIGEGGGRAASDRATDQYLLGDQDRPPSPASDPAPAQTSVAPPAPVSAPTPVPSPTPARAPAPARDSVSAVSPAAARPVGRQSLWNGLVQPLDMTAAQAASASDPDAARASVDRDYETHILGMKNAPARPALPGVPAVSLSAPRSPSGQLFVSLALDPREAGSLRDAVAGLGASAGFSSDARFEAMPGPNGTVMFSGWMPSVRIGDALKQPGVKSLRIETRARPSSPSETSGEYLIGLRLDDATHAREGVDAGIQALVSAAGFRLTRILGVETAPDGRVVGLVSGVLPLSRLARVMELAEVVKILPVGGEPAAPVLATAPAADDSGLSGFANFAIHHDAWLIVLTLLLLLPLLREPARRALETFNPYR